MELKPSSAFTIIRQIDNINDTNTYYIQAVIRNLNTDAVLATVKLNSKGNQRYTAPWQVIADTSGLGTYISITTYVYDDSGYSVPDQNYATEEHTYLVIQPPVSTYGNGGTTIVDYDKIKKFISDIKFPGIPNYDKEFTEMRKFHAENLDGMRKHFENQIKSISIPKYDDKEVHRSIAFLSSELSAIRQEHLAHSRELYETFNKGMSDMKSHHEKTVKSLLDEVKKSSSVKLAAEKEAQDWKQKHDIMRRNYDQLTDMLRSIPINEDEKPKTVSIEERVKKLLGQ